jgi:hypothetical protein
LLTTILYRRGYTKSGFFATCITRADAQQAPAQEQDAVDRPLASGLALLCFRFQQDVEPGETVGGALDRRGLEVVVVARLLLERDKPLAYLPQHPQAEQLPILQSDVRVEGISYASFIPISSIVEKG